MKARADLSDLLQIDPSSYVTAEELLQLLTEDEVLESENVLDALSRDAVRDPRNPDHELSRLCITGYNRIRSSRGIKFALYLLVRSPSLTREVVRYLLNVIDESNSHQVKVGTLRALHSAETIHGWQNHWLIALLKDERILSLLTEDEAGAIYASAIDKNVDWPTRMMAVRLIGSRKEQAKVRSFIEMYDDESDPDLKHAILESARCLGGPERKAFYNAHEDDDDLTKLVVHYLNATA